MGFRPLKTSTVELRLPINFLERERETLPSKKFCLPLTFPSCKETNDLSCIRLLGIVIQRKVVLP